MFEWFNKKTSVVPIDIDSALLTSVCCRLKINTQINIPENVVCYVSYKDKIYCEKEQELIINSDNLQDLITRQYKDKKPKKLNLDLFFVNKNKQDKEFLIKDKIRIDLKLVKVLFKIKLCLQITKPKKFLSFVLAELALPSALDTDNFLNNYLTERLKSYFLRKNLDKPMLDTNLLENLQRNFQKFLQSVGINLIDLNIQLSTNEELATKKISIFNETKKHNDILQEAKTETVETIDKNENNNYNVNATQDKIKESLNNNNLCTICGHKIIKGSKYCHICGATLN